jgi:fermentation-respiration switch protein FrsA (DUF1100 family)
VAEELRFRSGGDECAATIFRPAGTGTPVPCVVMANGVSMTRLDGVPRFAERFAQSGVAALTVDFRHFGESGGEPRQLVDVERQRADLLAAVSFARSLEGIDASRTAVWGFSLGGGVAVQVAAADPTLTAAVAMLPFLDGFAYALGGNWRTNGRYLVATARAALKRELLEVAAAGPPGSLAVLPQPEALPGFEAVCADNPLWRNQLRSKPSDMAPRFRPVRSAGEVRCPLMVCLGTDDTIVPRRAIEKAASRAPRGELHRYPTSHFGPFLHDFDKLCGDQVDFLARHLAPGRTT